MKKQFFLLASIIFLTSACSIYHVDSKDTTSEYYPPKNSANDVVYLEKVDRPHDIISTITVNTERIQTMDNVLEKIKREAAILGADAVTDIKTDATGIWKKLPAQKVIGNAYVRENFTASAIIFK